MARVGVGEPAAQLFQFRLGGGRPVRVTAQDRDERRDEQHPQQHHEHGRGQPDPHGLADAESRLGVLVEQRLELQAHEQEDPAFQQERDRLPGHRLG